MCLSLKQREQQSGYLKDLANALDVFKFCVKCGKQFKIQNKEDTDKYCSVSCYFKEEDIAEDFNKFKEVF